jgi:hypothetical protein
MRRKVLCELLRRQAAVGDVSSQHFLVVPAITLHAVPAKSRAFAGATDEASEQIKNTLASL